MTIDNEGEPSVATPLERSVDAAWQEEVEERIAAMDRGEMKIYSVEEVHEELRKSLEQK